jgi:endonuclease/exonuclease/phosphatase family metal-dependent hydrolase
MTTDRWWLVRLSLLMVLGMGGGLFAGCRADPAQTPAATAPADEAMAAPAERAVTEFTVVDEPFIARQQPDDLRVVAFNINSVFPETHYLDSERFARVLRVLAPDVICLQEVRSELDDAALATLVANALGEDAAGWHAYIGRSGRMGTAIVARYPLQQTGDVTQPPAYRGHENSGRTARVAYGLVDLPDDEHPIDLFVTSVHFKCCGDTDNDPLRQQEIDAVLAWWRDAMTPGDAIDVPPRTGFVLAGDLNTVGGPIILETALSGDIYDNERYGPDLAPDWDRTRLTDAHPRHNVVGPADYTWRNDTSQYPPGRLDYIIYSDSVLSLVRTFVLNTEAMTPELLAHYGLERFDIAEDEFGREIDHYPLVADFRIAPGVAASSSR